MTVWFKIALRHSRRTAVLLGVLTAFIPSAVLANPGPPAASLAACAASVSVGHPVPATALVPPSRMQALAKGINLTDAFRPDLSDAQLLQDLQLIQNSGLRHIRIFIDPALVLAWPWTGDPDATLHRLDATVCQAAAMGLAVVLTLCPQGELALTDAAQPGTIDSIALAWDRLAARYAGFTPDLVLFEAMNEPNMTDAGAYASMQQMLLGHIRSAAPLHTVLLTASPLSTAYALSAIAPVDDGNVVYVFHFYSPLSFTHQGAEWASDELGSIRQLLYPAQSGNVYDVTRQALSIAATALLDYLTFFADTQAIKREINVAAQWARANNVPVVANEFGVYLLAPSTSRMNWISDVRQAFEAQGIGWTLWEYRGGFGIDAALGLGCVNESPRAALGLCGK